jgi:hypothetical protein
MIRVFQCVHTKKIHGIYFARYAEERGSVVLLCNRALFFKFQSENRAISFFLSSHFGESFPGRVSSDNPRLKAFCRVAPSVLFKLRAISAVRLLLRASLFSVRICSAVHVRLFICPPNYKDCRHALIVTIPHLPDSDLNHSYLYLLRARVKNRHQ